MRQPGMMFRCSRNTDRSVREVWLEGRWLDVADFSPELLERADMRFLAHGDGLITIRTRDETATYGVIGKGEQIGVRSTWRARLLNVRPVEAG